MASRVWSELPPELLASIGKRLPTRIDVLRFRSVCSSWRSSLPFGTWPPPLPLTVPFPIEPHFSPHPRCHCSVAEATVYRLQPVHNPSDSPPKAWIIKVSENLPKGKMRLLNPLSMDIITPLPQNFPTRIDLSQFRISEICRSCSLGLTYDFDNPDYINQFSMAQKHQGMVNSVQKAVFFDDLTAVVIHIYSDVAVLRLGEERWTQLVRHRGNYRDLIKFKGKVYAVNHWGESLMIDSSLNMREFSSFDSPFNLPMGNEKHLLESCGELWLLDRGWRGLSGNVWYYQHKHTMLKKVQKEEIWFKAYKLNEEEHKWVEVPDLGDRILFAGRDCSFSVSAADFEGCNCKGNCVFFMNSCSESGDEDYSSCSDENYHDDYDALGDGGEVPGIYRTGDLCIDKLAAYPGYANHVDYDALRGSFGEEPAIFLIGDHCVEKLAAYPGYADLCWSLPSWLASGSSSSSQS
ncbi:hypothetical protein RHMOL_Rhmol10G0293300 [Rhododendron molle]|uniref:Uncharacterized protein n=1 Tax=Rhododendron molle TaxID=49168 RepID=A0ACC0M9B0_RHOML|nr:hypothetical protein RHMOL_Rhmol10G0293300 [Rhododendron molle]